MVDTTLHGLFSSQLFSSQLWATVAQVISLCNVAPNRTRQHCRLFSCKNLFLGCGPTGTSNFLVQCCLRRIWTTLSIQYSYAIQPHLNRHNIVQVLLLRCRLIVGQYCISKTLVQFWPSNSRQHCTEKNPVQCCLNTLGTILHRQKPCAMLPKRLQTTLHWKKNSLTYGCLKFQGLSENLAWKLKLLSDSQLAFCCTKNKLASHFHFTFFAASHFQRHIFILEILSLRNFFCSSSLLQQ